MPQRLLLSLLMLLTPAITLPEPEPRPDTNDILKIIGVFGMGHGCPIASDKAFTNTHVLDPRPEAMDSKPWPARWSQTGLETNTVIEPTRQWMRDDLVLGTLTPKVERFYHIAANPPAIGERLWWTSYNWDSKKVALAEEQLNGKVLRIVAGYIVIDSPTPHGSSGSCVLNVKGEVVGIVTVRIGTKSEQVVTGAIGVWGDWASGITAPPAPKPEEPANDTPR